MGGHDAGYKRLFSHRDMVADLLSGFVQEPWVQEVRLETLERVSGSYVSDELREREDDIVWRVQWRDQWLYVYLLLEFQSTVDRYMALRIMVYVGMLYQDLIRAKKLPKNGRLPPVLPIVLYNGDKRWTAARDVRELMEELPRGLERYRPRIRYLLLEERQYDEAELAAMPNVVAALFRLENSRAPADVRQVIDALNRWLREPDQSDLRRAFVVWLRQVLLPRRMPEVKLPELENLQEVRTLLAERVKEWTQKWREEGHKEGREEGLKEGAAQLLIRQLEQKFGSLDTSVRRRVADAAPDCYLTWCERLLTADRLEDVFR